MKRRSVARDLRLSSFTGPLQVLVAAASQAMLYPVIVRVSGLEVVGLWALIATVISYVGLSDAGFTPLITRRISNRSGDGELDGIDGDCKAAKKLYMAVALLLLMCWSVLCFLRPSWITGYSWEGIVTSVALLIVGSVIQLIALLNAAVLTGFHITYAAQGAAALGPVVRLGAGLAGALIGHPIEGLSIGFMLESIMRLYLTALAIRRFVPEWSRRPADQSHSLAEQLGRLRGMAHASGTLYSISLGTAIRDPVFRVIITSTLGLAAGGIYDIGRKVPELLRSVLAGGAQSYYPALGSYIVQKRQDCIRSLIQRSAFLLTSATGIVLGSYAIAARPVLEYWLGFKSPELVQVTQWSSLWMYITVLNIPYWYLLHAARLERYAALSLYSHAIAAAALFPLTFVWKPSIAQVAAYWCLSAIAPQTFIYAAVHSRLKLLLTTMFPLPAVTWAALGIIAAGFVCWAGGGMPERSASEVIGAAFIYAVATSALCLFLFRLLPQTTNPE